MQKHWLPSLFYLIVFICVFIIGYHEFRMFPDYWQIRLGIPSVAFYVLAALGLLSLRILQYKKVIKLETAVLDNVFGVVVSVLLLAAYLTIKELILNSNYAFLEYNVLSLEFLGFGLIVSALFFLSLPVAYLRQRARLLLFSIPLFLYAIFLYVYLDNESRFMSLVAEDSWVEYSTSLFFLLSGLGLFWLQKYVKHTFIRLGVILAATGLLVIAGEEVSWGQRIFNIATPEVIAQHNTQGEITLHNQSFIYQFIVPAYVVIGLIAGLFAPMLKRVVHQSKTSVLSLLGFWLPGFLTSFYFLQLSIQRYLTREFTISSLKFLEWDLVIWNEFSEAVAALGVLVFVLSLVVTQYDYNQTTSKRK